MNFRFTAAALAAFLAVLASAPACLAQAPATPEKVVTIEGITEYRLDNGLRVVLTPDPSAPNVTLSLTVLVGSRHEGYGEAGMAHLLEHMLFKGTPTHTDIPRQLKERGANYNATTAQDRTMYYERLPGTEANLKFALELEADRLVHSLIRREDLLSEMTVVRNEFEMGENSPGGVLRQRMLSAAYLWHNYGKATIGNRSDIERVPIDRLRTFYRKYYRPDNAFLSIGGRFDEAKALGLIAPTFGAIPRPTRRLESTYTEEPPQDGDRRVVLRRVGKVGLVGLTYHVPAASHEDFPALQILNSILSDEPSGSLYRALVPTGKASAVSGVVFALHDPGVLMVTAQADTRALEELRDLLTRLMEDPAKRQVSAEGVERAKRRMLKEQELLMADSNAVAMVLGAYEAMGDWRLLFLYRDRVEKVTTDDVVRVAARYVVPSNRTSGLFLPTEHPERAQVPEAPPLTEAFKEYRGRQEVAAGEAFEPTPANIEARVRRSTLPSGLKMALLPKKTRGGKVVLSLTLRYGNEQSLRGHTSATQFLGTLLGRGTKKHTRQQFQDEVDSLGAHLQTGGSLGSVTVSIEARRKNFPQVLRLLGEALREPIFPDEELSVLKHETHDGLKRGLTEPTALAFREVQRRMTPYSPADVRYVPTIEESMTRLQAVTREEVVRLYQDQLGAQSGELAIVGDFDPETVGRELKTFLGDWRAGTAYARVSRPAHVEIPTSRTAILTPDKPNAVYAAGEWLAVGDTDPDYAALEIANHLLGGSTLSSRLGTRIRVKGGLSYGVSSQLVTDTQDRATRFAVFAIANPTNLPRVEQAVREELERLLRDGTTTVEVKEARRAYLEERKEARGDDGRLASELVAHLYNGRTFAYDADLEGKVADLTAGMVDAATRRRLDPGRLIVVVAGDFNKKAEKK